MEILYTLKYRINVQQILLRFWVLAHLSTGLFHTKQQYVQKNAVQNLFLPPIYYLHAYLVYTFIRYLRVYKVFLIELSE